MVLAATRIDGFWHHRLWIFALAGGSTDQLNRSKGKHHALNQYPRGQQAVREKSAIICNQVEASGIAIKRLAGSEKNRAHHHENNCGRVLHGESQPDAGDNQYYGTKYGPFTATEQRHHKGPGNA